MKETGLLLSFILLYFYCSGNEATLLQRTYANCQILDSASDFRLYWTVNGNNIDLGMEAPLRGYISAGLSTQANMQGGGAYNFADAWVASWTNNAGDYCNGGCLFDVWMPNQGQPRKDTQQDTTTNKAIYQDATSLAAEWTRALNTGSATEDYAITTTKPMVAIWGGHVQSPVTGATGIIPYHPVYGAAAINFGQPSECLETSGTSTNGDSGGGSSKYTSPGGEFTTSWEIQGDIITFTMSGKTTGWISV